MYNRATKKVVIDAGHGGADPGAVSGNLKEKDLNLEAAQYMYKRLQELGIPSTIVRNTDETLERKERINRIMNAYGNSPDVIMISNHINAGGGVNPSGKLTFFEKNKILKTIYIKNKLSFYLLYILSKIKNKKYVPNIEKVSQIIYNEYR